MDTLQVNNLAPIFIFENADGKSFSLDQFRGKRVVLYFYPKNDTP